MSKEMLLMIRLVVVTLVLILISRVMYIGFVPQLIFNLIVVYLVMKLIDWVLKDKLKEKSR